MLRKILRKLGAVRTSLAVAGGSVLCLVFLYVVFSAILGRMFVEGIVIAASIPALVVPLLAYSFLRLLLKLDLKEEALRESEERFRTVVEDMPALICRFLPDGTLTFVSNGYCEYFNKEREDLVGQNFFQFIPEEEQERVRGHFTSLSEQTPMVTYEHQVIAPDGKIRWQQWTDRALFDEQARAVEYQSIGTDITERKEAEEALRRSEGRFRELAELLPETIFEVDVKGNLTFVNRKAFDYFRYSEPDFDRGLNAFDMLAPEDRDRAKENISKILRGEEAGLSEYTALRKDGSSFPCMVRSARIIHDGKPAGLRGFIIDLTGRKQEEVSRRKLEAQLQHAQRIEALGTLAGGIAHNFNNLLAGIMGNASLALLDTDPTHPHYERLKKIEKLVESGSQLTKQLLGYARKGRYDIRPLNLNQLVEETSTTFGAAKKEIRVHQELAEDLWGIKADQGQIEQALLNLFVNAADAMPGGGDLFLKTMNVTDKDIRDKPYKPEPGAYASLMVRDTGIGMNKETLDRVFEPFFTTKGLGAGTGLGLASVYGIIKAHRGYIDVDSKKGSGTTFQVYLPASESKAERALKTAQHPVKGSETILLVDDEVMVLEVGVEVLKDLGYTVLQAQGGGEAVELYSRNRDDIDLVILDMIMPDLGGGQAYDRLKDIDHKVKVLLSSGYGIDGQATEILNRGCNGFIQKPFGITELSAKIREVLDKE